MKIGKICEGTRLMRRDSVAEDERSPIINCLYVVYIETGDARQLGMDHAYHQRPAPEPELDLNAVNELFENVIYGEGLAVDNGAEQRRLEFESRRLGRNSYTLFVCCVRFSGSFPLYKCSDNDNRFRSGATSTGKCTESGSG